MLLYTVEIQESFPNLQDASVECKSLFSPYLFPFPFCIRGKSRFYSFLPQERTVAVFLDSISKSNRIRGKRGLGIPRARTHDHYSLPAPSVGELVSHLTKDPMPQAQYSSSPDPIWRDGDGWGSRHHYPRHHRILIQLLERRRGKNSFIINSKY